MTPPLFSVPAIRVDDVRARLALMLACCALGMAVALPAHAAQPDTKTAATNTSTSASTSAASSASGSPAAAAPDKVYPPLPSLTMLPPSTDSDDDAPPRKSTSKKKGAAAKVKNEMPTPRLVVSDATRSYLNSVEQDIDRALQK